LSEYRKKEEAENDRKKKRVKGSHITPEVKISDELADFMDLPHGSKTSRPQALGFVSKYAKENKLNGKMNGDKMDNRIINMDDKLKKLFPNIADNGEELTFTNIMTNLKDHFKKNNEE
jgi:chromatin remodeling complex protein RSC6